MQNGRDNTGNGLKTILLSTPYLDNSYTIQCTSENGTNAYATAYTNRTTTSFQVYKSNTSCSWETKGYIR